MWYILHQLSTSIYLYHAVLVLMFFLHGIATATITLYLLVCTGMNSFYMGILQLTLYCSHVVVVVVHGVHVIS